MIKSEGDIEHRGLLTNVEQPVDDNEELRSERTRRPTRNYSRILIWLLPLSLIANVVLLVSNFRSPSRTAPSSKYANLQRGREEPFVLVTPYSSDNETLRDQLWYDINVDSAMVALSDDWAREHDIRMAQRFPWDQSKGIYLLHGFHNLHCLKIVYISLSEHRRGLAQTRSQHHVNHCLDALRRQIVCDADDTPRATDRRAEVVSGLWQHRQCRSWDELEAFARQHTACYKRPDDPEAGGQSKLERFKHCPPDSGYVVTDDYVPTDEVMVGLPGESILDQ